MLAFTPLTCGLMGYQPSRWAVGPTHTSRGRAAVSLSANPPSVLCVGECLFDALHYADPYVPEPPYCTYGLRVPASGVAYVPEAQGSCCATALPSGIFLGGAPLNVACHLSELGAKASFASAVGDDRLGREALRRLKALEQP
eukprot:scaffold25197_cov30-Phaeocystis_antarctica.AAC.1